MLYIMVVWLGNVKMPNTVVPSIQLAFQGGGAKLIDMLPVAAAFLECQRNRRIQITAVSGTSAGAICAALLANQSNFDTLREYLADRGTEHLRAIMPPEVEKLKQLSQSGWLRKATIFWQNASYLSGIIFGGRPAFNEQEYRVFIKKILSFGDPAIETFEMSKNKGLTLFINASDIARSESHVHVSGNIVDAVVDSSSIPFAFRSFSKLSVNHFVDGGLCDNLPVDCLVQHSKDPVFAVFPEDRDDTGEISNILTYVLRLFSASINHSVKRSKERVSKAFSKSVKTDLSTFDFAAAIARLGNAEWFESEKERHIEDIVDFANSYGGYNSDFDFRYIDVNQTEDYIESLEMLTNNYCDLFEYEVGRFEIRVICDELIPANGPELKRRPADTITKIARLRATSANFRYFKSAMNIDPATGEPLPTLWTAFNVTTNKAIPIKVLALKKSAGSLKVGVACLVVFVDHSQHLSLGDVIELRDTAYIRDGMKALNRGQQDFFGLENPHARTVKMAELVLTYPARLGDIRLLNHPSRSNIPDLAVTPIAFTWDEQRNRGQNMRTLGLRCHDVETGQQFYCMALPQ
jgi:predicted acylesterase/phospholipase RssA